MSSTGLSTGPHLHLEIRLGSADEFIQALCVLVKRLAVDKLHIVGDIFDRGPHAEKIMDLLLNHHAVDLEWGNHDVLWMGAWVRAPGSPRRTVAVSSPTVAWKTWPVVANSQ